MNIDHVQARQWLHAYHDADGKYAVDAAVLPSFTSLYTISALAKSMGLNNLSFGAQTVSDTDAGAFTGDVSASMLSALGCRYVLIGHSEQRRYHPEDDDRISSKVQAVLHEHMTPIICIGESKTERMQNPGITYPLIQLGEAIKGLTKDDMSDIIIAYEPVFSIGSGSMLSDMDIESALRDIRLFIASVYGDMASEHIRILYGGSVNADNADSLIRLHDVDGFLVGGASLQPDAFIDIMHSVSSSLPYKMHAPQPSAYGSLHEYPEYDGEARQAISVMTIRQTMMIALSIAAYRTVGFGTILNIAEEHAINASDASGVFEISRKNALHDTILYMRNIVARNMVYAIHHHLIPNVVSVRQWMTFNDDTIGHDERCSSLLHEYALHACEHAYERYQGTLSPDEFSKVFIDAYMQCDEDARNRHWRKRGIDNE